ncbi:hypothetical protein J4G37_16135 [Microvirga sp. 3-52]|nr:hypothetical protein [Microvirga sp. 3-52]
MVAVAGTLPSPDGHDRIPCNNARKGKPAQIGGRVEMPLHAPEEAKPYHVL